MKNGISDDGLRRIAKFVQADDESEDQLEKGIKVEMEHTDDLQVAEKIAKDHLEEHADYYDRLEEMEKEAQYKEPLSPSMFTKYEVSEDPVAAEFMQFIEENPDAAAWEIRDWAEGKGYDPMTILNYLEKAELGEEALKGFGLEDYVHPESTYADVYVDTVGVYNVYTKSYVEAKGYTYRLSDGGLIVQDVGSFFEAKPILLAPNGGAISEFSPVGQLYLKAMQDASDKGALYELTPEEQKTFNYIVDTSYPVGTSSENPQGFFSKVKGLF